MSYTYDAEERLHSVEYAVESGVTKLTYEYNERNWLKKVIATVKKGSTEREVDLRYYTYNRYGNVKVIRDCQDFLLSEDNYLVKSFTYDVYNRVSKISTANEGSSDSLQVDEYTYDKNGNILTKVEMRSGEETTTSYTYDSQNRLVSSKETKGDVVKSCSYEYDLTGNRTKVTVDGKETVSTYNGLNQLTSQTVDGVTTNFTYDGAGNQIKEMCGDNAKSYEYDVKNRLTKVTATTGSAVKVLQENAYNGDGQRICKVENGSETVYYYQNGSLYQTTDGAENVTAMYLYGSAGNAIAVEDFTGEEVEAYTYVKDAQGSVCQLTVNDGVKM